VRLEAKGRGRALRAAWVAEQARVVAYMDVDLSTDVTARDVDNTTIGAGEVATVVRCPDVGLLTTLDPVRASTVDLSTSKLPACPQSAVSAGILLAADGNDTRLTEDETAALAGVRSARARAAVRDYIDRTSRRELLDEVLDEQLPRYAEALRRLG
jgi:hypothetical protein